MPESPAHLLPQLAAVAGMVAFHLLVASRLLRIVVGHHKDRRSRMRFVLMAGVVLLDVPIAHSFLAYKHFSPLLLDQLMSSTSWLFLAVHANVLIFGIGLLVRDFVLRPLRLRAIRRKRDENRRRRLAELARRIPADSRLMAPARAGMERLAAMRSAAQPRRRFIRTAALAATGVVTSAGTLSAMRTTDEEQIERVKIRIPGLPPALKGTTIALISDIHSSVYMTREQMERYKKELNAMKADVIVVAGDFINSKLLEVYPFAEAFSGLSAPLGVYGVTGNHDYYPRDIETVVREVEQAGIKVLRQDNIPLQKNGETFWLMGIDDAHIYEINQYLDAGKTESGRIENMMKGIPEDGTKLLMCHKPYPFEEYSQLGVDLMLSGHTHGGQIVLAQLDNINLSFASLASRYVAGLYRTRTKAASQMYVSRGVGTVGIPIRVNCPPEVTHIVLV